MKARGLFKVLLLTLLFMTACGGDKNSTANNSVNTTTASNPYIPVGCTSNCPAINGLEQLRTGITNNYFQAQYYNTEFYRFYEVTQEVSQKDGWWILPDYNVVKNKVEDTFERTGYKSSDSIIHEYGSTKSELINYLLNLVNITNILDYRQSGTYHEIYSRDGIIYGFDTSVPITANPVSIFFLDTRKYIIYDYYSRGF